jgi:hypothetical protein
MKDYYSLDFLAYVWNTRLLFFERDGHASDKATAAFFLQEGQVSYLPSPVYLSCQRLDRNCKNLATSHICTGAIDRTAYNAAKALS